MKGKPVPYKGSIPEKDYLAPEVLVFNPTGIERQVTPATPAPSSNVAGVGVVPATIKIKHTFGKREEQAEAVTFFGVERPRTMEQVFGTFGRDCGVDATSGFVDFPTFRKPTKTRVHIKLVHLFSEFISLIEANNLTSLIQTVQGSAMAGMRGSTMESKPSPVSWGIGLLINEGFNDAAMVRVIPTGQPGERTRLMLPGYTFYAGHPIVTIAESIGLTWAGREVYPNGSKNKFVDSGLFFFAEEW